MSDPKKKYIVRFADSVAEKPVVLSLWESGFEHVEDLATRYDWLYLNNPAGQGYVYSLDHTESEKTVGAVGLAIRKWRIGQQYINAGIMADLVVDFEHRSLGPAIKLHNNSIDQSLESLDLVYGFPNSKSAALAKFAKFQMTADIVRYAKPLRFYSYLRKRLPGFLAAPAAFVIDGCVKLLMHSRLFFARLKWGFESETGLDRRFDQLWSSTDTAGHIIGQRDSAFLKWRFLQSTIRDFKVFTIVNKQTQQLDGYIVYYLEKDNWAVISDFFARDFGATLKALFLFFEKQMREIDCKAVSLTCYGSEEVVRSIMQSGFKPRETNKFSCKWTDRFYQIKSDNNWYFTPADNDI